jgi:hypothetical protein
MLASSRLSPDLLQTPKAGNTVFAVVYTDLMQAALMMTSYEILPSRLFFQFFRRLSLPWLQVV